jgi:hypothetical protein
MLHAGGCICGAVRYEIMGEPHVTYACHCTDCRRQSGSAFGLTIVITADQLKITRGELKTHSRVAESGRTMTRYFCPECGTWIYNVPETLPNSRRIKPGTLDDASWVRPTVHLWVRSALPWVQIPADAIKYETQPSDRSWVVPPSKPSSAVDEGARPLPDVRGS